MHTLYLGRDCDEHGSGLKPEEKGIKAEGASKDVTIQFDFRVSTSATSPAGQGADGWTNDSENQLKKFSLRREKYDRKGDFEGWVN